METCKWIYWWGQSSSWFCSHFLFSIFRAHFPLSIPLSPFPASRSPLPTPYFSNICRATLDSNPHSSFKLPVNSKKHKNHQNVMSTKKFQFVVVSLFTCLYNRKKNRYYSTNKDCRIVLTLHAYGSYKTLVFKAKPVAVYNLQVSEGWLRQQPSPIP